MVVKVQRPGVRPVVDRDLDIVGLLAATLDSQTPWGRIAGAVGLVAGFAQAVREELDFRIEARNLTAVAVGYLLKGCTREELTAAVRTAARGGTAIAAPVRAGWPGTCAATWRS